MLEGSRGIADEIGAYLSQVAAATRDVLAERFAGMWVVGSLATGDFDPGRSDIDVLAGHTGVLDEPTKDALIGRLSHTALPCPAHGLDFILYPAAELSQPGRAPNYAVSLASGPDWGDEIGAGGPYRGGLIDLSVARSRGLAVAGRPAAHAVGEVSRSWVLQELAESILWHRTKVHDPFHDPYGTNGVLNACRALSFAATGEWGSKSDGAAWYLERTDSDVVRAARAHRANAATGRLDREAVVTFLDGAHSGLQDSPR